MINTPPTIQEAFEAIICPKRCDYTLEDAFDMACEDFTKIYNIQPPYISCESYKAVRSRKTRVRNLRY